MKKLKKVLGIFVLTAIMMLPAISAFAYYTKNFTFDMTHQLTIGTYKSTRGWTDATVNMSSWGGATTFAIKVFDESLFNAPYLGEMTFTKSSAGSPYSDFIYTTTGHSYDYEIWKAQDGKRIIGSGSLEY